MFFQIKLSIIIEFIPVHAISNKWLDTTHAENRQAPDIKDTRLFLKSLKRKKIPP